MKHSSFLAEHADVTWRFFLQAGVSGLSAIHTVNGLADETVRTEPKKRSKPDKAGVQPDPYFTSAEDFKKMPGAWYLFVACLIGMHDSRNSQQ